MFVSLAIALAGVRVAPADDAASTPGEVVAGSPAAEPLGDLTLADALAAVLTGNPELVVYGWDLRAKDAEVVQASRLPNPELAVSNENLVGSGYFGRRQQYQNTLLLSQLIELGGKRERRTEAAERLRDRTAAEYEAKRVDVLTGTTLDFVAVLSSQHGAAIAREAAAQARDLLRAVRGRVRAGAASRLEEARAAVALRRAEIAEDHAGHELLAARRTLAARWGSKTPRFARASGDLFDAPPVPTFEALAERLRAAPERRVAESEERLRAALAALARTKRVPDVGVGLGWRQGRDFGDQTAVAELTVPLPVFNRWDGEIAAADALTSGASAGTAALAVRLDRALFALHLELLHARAEMTAMREEILPRSEEALGLARAGYGEGVFSQLDLIDAQRTLTEVRRERLRAATTFHQLASEIERLLGEGLWGKELQNGRGNP